MTETKEILLTQNKIAIVDATDYEWLSKFKWHAFWDGWNWYAQRQERKPNGKWTTAEMHRVILEAPAGMQVDHKDGDGLNNTRDNLRPATRSQNMHNKRKNSNNTSGYKGVSWRKDHNRWVVQIGINGKVKHIGFFVIAEEAALAYDAAAKELYGEFAKLNFNYTHKEIKTMKYNYTTGTKGSVITLEDGRYADTVHGDSSEGPDASAALVVLLDEAEGAGWAAVEETLGDLSPAELQKYVGA